MSYLFAEECTEYLKREMSTRQQKRSAYSQRAFARDMGLAPSSLVDFLKGRIGFSKNRVQIIGQKIGLSNEQKSHWNDLIQVKFSRNQLEIKDAEFRIKHRLESEKNSLTLDQFAVVSEWFHFAYLELLSMDAEKFSDLKVAAKALKIPLKTLKIAVKRLVKLNFLRVNDGHFTVDPLTQIDAQIPSKAIQQFHYQLMTKALKSIEGQRMDERACTSTMVALTEDEFKIMFKRVQDLAMDSMKDIAATSENKTKLYCLSVQFFNLLNERGI